MVAPMKLGGRGRMDDGAALEDLFEHLPVSANWTMGFLSAIGSGPDPIASTTWIPEIVTEGAFEGSPKADLLERLFIAAGETLRSTPEIICPEPDKPEEEVVDFCTGYLRGARMHATWSKDETASGKLRPFELLAKEKTDADAQSSALREHLGRDVADLFAYWQAKRQVVNATPKVGRNDPCPCGSGKKHKKCCLAQPA